MSIVDESTEQAERAKARTTALVHPTAVVDRSATLADGVMIGPFAIVEPGATIGEGSVVHGHAIIASRARIGRRCVVHPFAVVGGEPQHRTHYADAGLAIVEDDCVLRESVTVHAGTNGRDTVVGADCLVMVGVHVGHDARVGRHVTIANHVQLAGHVTIDDSVTFGGRAAVAQHVHIGTYAFVAAGAMVERDVSPYVVVQGDRARPRGINRVGLTRAGFAPTSIKALERAFSRLHRPESTFEQALDAIDTSDPVVSAWIEALKAKRTRG